MKNNILEFQEHDLKISGTEETIVEFITTMRKLESESNMDLPNTIGDIVFQMECEIKSLNNMDEDDWDFK